MAIILENPCGGNPLWHLFSLRAILDLTKQEGKSVILRFADGCAVDIAQIEHCNTLHEVSLHQFSRGLEDFLQLDFAHREITGHVASHSFVVPAQQMHLPKQLKLFVEFSNSVLGN